VWNFAENLGGGCRRSPCSDATSGSSNFSFRSRNCLIVTGASIFGSQGEPHCLMASTATVRHFSTFQRPGLVIQVRGHTLGENRHDSDTPSSTAFSMMDSIQLALRYGLQQRDGAGRGGVKFFSDTESVTAVREHFSTAQRNSLPTPSKTVMSSPRAKRKTCSA